MARNALNIEIPEKLDGLGALEPYQGVWTKLQKGWMSEQTVPPAIKARMPHTSKMCDSLEEAILKCNPHD